jgi:hypothetical protein
LFSFSSSNEEMSFSALGRLEALGGSGERNSAEPKARRAERVGTSEST